MKSKQPSRKDFSEFCAEVYEDDGVDPIKYFKKAIKLDPDFAVAHKMLADIYADLGNTTNADKYRATYNTFSAEEKARTTSVDMDFIQAVNDGEFLGFNIESGADPEKVHITDFGLAREVKNLLLKPKAVGKSDYFKLNGEEIYWYAIFNNTGQFKNSGNPKYRLELYTPSGALYAEKDFKGYAY